MMTNRTPFLVTADGAGGASAAVRVGIRTCGGGGGGGCVFEVWVEMLDTPELGR
jgi:hypothetical protein